MTKNHQSTSSIWKKNNYTTKTIYKINKNGTDITNQTDILREITTFYKTLYTDNNINKDYQNQLDEFIDEIEIPKLTKAESNSLDGLLLLDECTNALKSMANNKSPGTSGFSADFYKVFWKRLGPFVCRALNFAFLSESLSITQTQGLIICIPKGDKPRQFLSNWRPLTLLNCIYKIGSSCIANRLKKYINKLVNKDQTGFIKNRFIGENTRLIYDIMEYTDQKQIQGLLLLIDFEKAFDSLSWKFVDSCLKMFNFGEDVKKWFKILYKDSISAVCQCGFLSDFFKIQKGCRQGDPLSCYIFILCAELLSLKIRSSSKIKGIKINDVEHKLTQFADDTTIILDGSEYSLNESLNVLAQYTLISGLKVNFNKTKVVWIGKKKYSSDTIKTKWKLSWNQNSFEMLGIKFHVDLHKIIEINYKQKITKMMSIIRNWKRRNLTPIGKITVVKALIMSLFNHLFTSLPNPSENIINEINTACTNFVWNGSVRVKKEVLKQSYEKGGLNYPDINAFITALKLTWVRRLLSQESPWINLAKTCFDINMFLNFGKEYAVKKIKLIKNDFWKDTLKAYIKYINKINIPNHELLGIPIFYNQSIKIDNKPIYLKTWYDAGVHHILDMFDTNNKLYQLEEFNKIYKLKENFITFNGVKHSIMSYLKQQQFSKDKALERPFIPFFLRQILTKKKGTKPFYNTLINTTVTPICKQKWSEKLNTVLSDKDWTDYFSLPFKITNDFNLQWFQFRILHRIIGTNYLLSKMKIKNSSLCTFCGIEDETIEHFFLYCSKTKLFLNRFFRNFKDKHKITNISLIFGIPNEKNDLVNLLLLLVKRYIYNCRVNEELPNIIKAKRYLQFKYQVIKETAVFKNTWLSQEETWQDIVRFLNNLEQDI